MSIAHLKPYLPYINFGVAAAALTFQISVLYPWHMILDEDFQKLKKDQEEKLKEFHKLKLERLERIESKIERLLDAVATKVK